MTPEMPLGRTFIRHFRDMDIHSGDGKGPVMTSQVDGAIRARAHAQSTQDPFAEIVSFLKEHLGASLVAFMANVDSRTVNRWISAAAAPRDAAERRVRSLYQIYKLLEPHEAPQTIRAWFMGMNPQLDDESPAESILADRSRDALMAARAFIAGG